MIRRFTWLGGLLVVAGGAHAQDAARGSAVFQDWCAPCHAPGPRHPGTQALEALYTGVSVMPPFRKTEISDADLEALAAYLAPKRR
jgi:mono/diheme cytochrome c family protein